MRMRLLWSTIVSKYKSNINEIQSTIEKRLLQIQYRTYTDRDNKTDKLMTQITTSWYKSR